MRNRVVVQILMGMLLAHAAQARLRAGALFLRQTTGDLVRRLNLNTTTWLLGAAFGVAVLAGVAVSVVGSGWLAMAADLSVNVAASVVVGAGAVVAFVVTSRRQALGRLIAAQRGNAVEADHQPGDRFRQAQAVAAQLTDLRQSGSIVVEAAPGSGRTAFLRQLVDVLSDVGVVAVELGGWDIARASVVQAATETFHRLMARAGVDAPLLRTMELLAKRRQIVILVDGLDSSAHAARQTSAVEMTRRRLEELSAAHLAHVVIVNASSVPQELVRSRLRLAPIGQAALVNAVTGSNAVPDAALEALSRHLGSALAHLRLSLHTLRAAAMEFHGTDREIVLSRLYERVHIDGPTSFLMERLRLVGLDVVGAGSRPESPSAKALGRLVEHLLLYDSTEVSWTQLVARLQWAEIDEFVLGVAELERFALVERQEYAGELSIRFLDPEMRELAVGIHLAASRTAFIHSGGRGGAALTGELIARAAQAEEPQAAERIWSHACQVALRGGHLSAIGDADRALRPLGITVRPMPTEQLDALWQAADDPDRTLFVKRLQQKLDDSTIDYLWSRLRAPLFRQTSHGLRRDISAALFERGDNVWQQLRGAWEADVAAAEGPGLAWRARLGEAWRVHGNAVASLCWILPAITMTTNGKAGSEARALLSRLLVAVVPGGDLSDDRRPDPGVEISLAEGCKDAAHQAMSGGRPLSDQLWDIMTVIAATGRSWVSRLLAVQACALAAAADESRIETLLAVADASAKDAHPITGQYAQMLAAFVRSRPGKLNHDVYTVVWPDDTDALAAAGNELDDRSARALAATTIVLNLLEGRLRVDLSNLAGARLRVGALTSDALPGCLASRLLAYGADAGHCGCNLGLCGSELDVRDLRHISRPFAHRCLASNTPKTTSYDRALDTHLRRLSQY